MKDLVLILVILAFFIFGYCIMKKVDAFFEENQRRIESESPNGVSPPPMDREIRAKPGPSKLPVDKSAVL